MSLRRFRAGRNADGPRCIAVLTLALLLLLGPQPGKAIGASAIVVSPGAGLETAQVQTAIASACGPGGSKIVDFTSGVYEIGATIEAQCSGLTLRRAPGSVGAVVWLLASAPAVDTKPLLLRIAGRDDVSVSGIIFDGNVSTFHLQRQAQPNWENALRAPLVQVDAPSSGVSFLGSGFRNAAGTGLDVVGQRPLMTGPLGMSTAAGTSEVVLPGVPDEDGVRVEVGSYVLGDQVLPDTFVTHIVGNKVTLSQPLADTLLPTYRLMFSRAVGMTVSGSTQVTVDKPASLTVGQTVIDPPSPAGGSCLSPKTRIVAIVGSTVHLDRPVTCPSGSLRRMAAAAGVSQLTIENTSFTWLGQPWRHQRLQKFTVVSAAAAGTNQLVLGCLPGVAPGVTQKCPGVPGVLPEARLATSGNPSTVPWGARVSTVSVNQAAGTHTVALAGADGVPNNLSGAVPADTELTFAIGLNQGKGFGSWMGWGAWFANVDNKVLDSTFTKTWLSPLLITAQKNLSVQGTNFYESSGDSRWSAEFESFDMAPSACIYLKSSIDTLLTNLYCNGTSGPGLELSMNVHLTVQHSAINGNGTNGIYACGGKGLTIRATQSINNGVNLSMLPPRNYKATHYSSGSGIMLGGSCSWSQPGTMSDITLTGVDVRDVRTVPRQEYPFAKWNHTSTLVNMCITNAQIAGNTGGWDPAFPPSGSIPTCPI